MWVIITLASLVVILILLLCVPLDMALHADIHGRPKFRLKLSWFFGLVNKEVGKGKKKPQEEKKVVKERRKPRERKRRIRAIFEILRTKGLLRQIQGLLRDVLSHLKIRKLGADFRVGLDNPADTGLLLAVIGPATLFLGSSRFHEIRVEPSFEDKAVFEGHLHGAVRLRPIQLVIPFLRFVFSLTAIRLLKKLVLTKWKGKR